MLALAKENQRKAGVTNVEFLKGNRADPAARRHGDVIISNCVINLSPTRTACSPEDFGCSSRAVVSLSDVVVRAGPGVRYARSVELWGRVPRGPARGERLPRQTATPGFEECR